jgi:hypothetical protein
LRSTVKNSRKTRRRTRQKGAKYYGKRKKYEKILKKAGEIYENFKEKDIERYGKTLMKDMKNVKKFSAEIIPLYSE